MGDRSLPPKVDGQPQGRLDLIFGKPTVFPPPQASQSFIFTFRWWGDTRPCILRLPPEKSETRITHVVTCSPHSFRQYLSDMRNLHVTLKIGGEGRDIHDSLEHLTQSPRRMEGETPRQKLFRRQQRFKKGWQDGDVVGSFVLPDIKLNARGDYINEGRILDSSGDLVGSIVVTMVFLEGTLEDFQQIKIQSEEHTYPQVTISPEKADGGVSRSRTSGIPVPESRIGKSQKTPTQEVFRPQSGSFRDTTKPKVDKLKSPKKQQQQNSFDSSVVEKENQAPYRRRTSSFTKVGREVSALQENTSVKKGNYQDSQLQQPGYTQLTQSSLPVKKMDLSRQQQDSVLTRPQEMEVKKSPQLPHRAIPQKVPMRSTEGMEDPSPVVRRERKPQEGDNGKARPASWGLYPLLNGADPHSLVDSGAMSAEELPILLQVLKGHSPNLDLSNFDLKTQKLLDGLDLSLSSNCLSPGKSIYDTKHLSSDNVKKRSRAFSVFNRGQKDKGELLGTALSGVWPLEDGKPEGDTQLPSLTTSSKIISGDAMKFDSPRKAPPPQSSKIPMSQGVRVPQRFQRSLSSCTGSDKKLFSVTDTSREIPRETEEPLGGKGERMMQDKYSLEEGSVLVVEVGTLTLASPLLPHSVPEEKKKVTGVRVLHRSRVCYLTTLDVILPDLETTPEWELSQTFASRQLLDHEVHYNMQEVLKMPPIPIADILKGHLIIKCVCRRLGERESEEVGSSSISLLDLWQLNGSQVQVPLFSSQPSGSLTRRQGRRARKVEDDKAQSFAHLTLTASLTFSSSKERGRDYGTHAMESKAKPDSQVAWNGAVVEATHKAQGENLYSKKINERTNLLTAVDSSSGSDLSESKYPVSDSRQYYSKPRIVIPSSYQEQSQPTDFNSIYLPTHVSPSDKTVRNNMYVQGMMGGMGSMMGAQHSPRITSSMEPGYQGYHSSFLSVISEHNGSNNQPVESGGESPCITAATDYCADFIDYNTLGWQVSVDARREEHIGCCRVHLEILKGRNLPWLEGDEGIPQPPNCYVRTNVGSLTVLTNVCRESVNPMWNFAADVLLPHSQLAQTSGSLILKVHHSEAHQRTSPDDLLLGFVSVDATSIWSGHVSLCGWYPLLDLRGTVRGHVKVSLTPHEPPLNVAASNMRQPAHPHSMSSCGPPLNQHLARHTYPQCSAQLGKLHAEGQCFPGDNIYSSVLNSVARPTDALPHFTSKNQREMYNQSLQGNKDSTSMEINRPVLSQKPEVSGHYKLADSNEKVEDSSHDKSEACLTFTKVTAGDKTQSASRKSSAIPVFASNKSGTMKSPRAEDKGKAHSILPKVEYKDKENIHPSSEVMSHGYCRHKGAIVVRGLAKEPTQDATQHTDTEFKSSNRDDLSLQQHQQQALENEAQKDPLLIKDSLIMSHFRMQKEKEREGEESVLGGNVGNKSGPLEKGVMSSSGSDNSQSDSQHSATESKTSSQSGNKPSSCLKAPGSPSLRVKHVTFAHKLVQHQNGGTKFPLHFSQNELNWRAHQPTQAAPLTRQDAVTPRDVRASHPLAMESSDLQVVPCREGDTQAQVATAVAQGSISMNGYGMPASHDRTKEDLIMAFSWMNQNSECDTPCVSFIEPKSPLMNNCEANGTCLNVKSPADEISVAPSPSISSSPKKSRKLRSRIAANFTMK